MSESAPFINSGRRSVRSTVHLAKKRLLNFIIIVLTCVVTYLVLTRYDRSFTQDTGDQYNYRQMILKSTDAWVAKASPTVESSTSEGNSVAKTEVMNATKASEVVTMTMITTTPSTITTTSPTTTSTASTTSTTLTTRIITTTTMPATSNLTDSTADTWSMVNPETRKYITASFSATCNGGGISNKLYEIISLYGIARTLGRIPYANLMSECILKHMKEMTSYFPLLVLAIELKIVPIDVTTDVDFANAKCCVYEDVGKLIAYNTSRFIAISADYLQSYKYFDRYKADVVKLLAFTAEDIAACDKIARETFKNDSNHKVCVHIRRGDFLKSSMHQCSTENFTMASVLYVREKLMLKGVNTTVAMLGDDRPWAKALFTNFSWVVVPPKTNRTTTDYAFAARYCQTIILTASASTFGFWSAYLSSAENVYYNEKFAKSTQLSNEFEPADVFPPTWICLRLNESTSTISEISRHK